MRATGRDGDGLIQRLLYLLNERPTLLQKVFMILISKLPVSEKDEEFTRLFLKRQALEGGVLKTYFRCPGRHE